MNFSEDRNTNKNFYDLPAGVALRGWQEKALRAVAACIKASFLLVAVPAAGKTLFALLVAWQFFRERRIKRVVVVCPSNHLRYQWAENAHKIGLNLDPNYNNCDGRESPDFQGVVVSYQQVAAAPELFRANCRDDTLVVFVEVHHVGDELTWGKAVRHAFEPAVFRLSLSGTPFRSDFNAIPFVDYVDNRCQSNFIYGYGEALADNVVRAIYFPTIEGNATWLSSDGKFKQRSLLDTVSGVEASERWRTILDPNGDWLRDVIKQADETLTEMRRNGHADAAGLIVAVDQNHAERLIETVEEVTGTKPVLVISDKADAQEAIRRFVTGEERWIIAVKMISEGVDIPRLRVCVYATNVCSELFLIQVIGRLLRKQANAEDQNAALYIPYIPELIKYAERIKEVREHVLKTKPGAFGAEQEQTYSGASYAPQGDDSADGTTGVGGSREAARANRFLPISSESKLYNTIFDGEQFTREELRQAEQISQEFGAPISPVLGAAFLRRGMALGAVRVVQSSNGKHSYQSSTGNDLPASAVQRDSNDSFGKPPFVSAETADFHCDKSVPVYVQQKTLRRQAQKLAVQLAVARQEKIEDVHRAWIRQGGVSQSKATVNELQQKVEWLLAEIKETQGNGR